jgi:D-alanyl-D-alanine carboxypeptidase/D-alanyl-D-alanine-endopeptidase (penicillin-binding protein 4)
VSVSVREAATGRVLVDIRSDVPRIPASNMKLLTTGAALVSLPADHAFGTKVFIDGSRIYLIGDGDPALADPDLLKAMRNSAGEPLDVEQMLSLWADWIVRSAGPDLNEIVVDDRVFDTQFWHPDWPRDQANRHYCAEVGGLNFHRNVLRLRPRPVHGGIELGASPSASSLPIINELKPARPGISTNSIAPLRTAETDTITVRGTVAIQQVVPVEITVHDPGLFTARLLADRLRQRGVDIREVRRIRLNEVPAGSALQLEFKTQLDQVLKQCNHESVNLYAEALLKYLGHTATGQPGSWANGGEALRSVIERRLGRTPVGLIVKDGSGMSRRNKVPPSLMTQWLATFADDTTVSQRFRETLPTPGEGTLGRRFANRNLHGCTMYAKTGYINAVSALSGLVVSPDGRTLTFSIIGNDLKDVRACKQLQDAIVSLIAESMAGR